jgi:serine/threonine-protein kinase
MSLRLGDRIADYEVIGMLGSGGMGAVYQVRHLISDRTEAMKVLLPDFEANPALAERFVREIRLQASLSHPNIASLHNALRFDNQLLMVMEFVDGRTLSDLIRSGPLEQIKALQVTIQVLSALDYAHSRAVIHRDVKPSNVMITPEGVAKLMDFGIARAAKDLGHLTQTGAAIGSMYYMSPEQIRGETLDGRADLYSTGVTLFEALTGRRPFAGSEAAQVLEAQLKEAPPDPAFLRAVITPELSRIVIKSLEKIPANRYQTAAAFRDDVLNVLGTLMARHASLTEPVMSYLQPPEKTPSSGTLFRPPTSSGPVTFDPLGLERVRKDLAQHIGPLARTLVDRAAKRARNWQELYAQLASEVPEGKERNRFLAGCPRF